jgi:hypothetical protein
LRNRGRRWPLGKNSRRKTTRYRPQCRSIYRPHRLHPGVFKCLRNRYRARLARLVINLVTCLSQAGKRLANP